MQITEVGTATLFPVDLELAKSHARVTVSDDDSYVEHLIKVATEYAERFTGLTLARRTWEIAFADFPRGYAGPDKMWGPYGLIELPRPRVIEVTSVTYVPPYTTDAPPSPVTIDPTAYRLSQDSRAAWLTPLPRWPVATTVLRDAVTIVYDAGPADDEASPPALLAPACAVQAILIMVRDLYDNRSDVVIGANVANLKAAESLLRPMRGRIW